MAICTRLVTSKLGEEVEHMALTAVPLVESEAAISTLASAPWPVELGAGSPTGKPHRQVLWGTQPATRPGEGSQRSGIDCSPTRLECLCAYL